VKKELGIESIKMSMGGPWVWRLPKPGSLALEGGAKSVEEYRNKNSLPSLPSMRSSATDGLCSILTEAL